MPKLDVVLLDPATIPLLTPEFLAGVRRTRPEIHALAIGMDEIESTFLKAVRAGATGYLLREASALEVIGAIRAVSQGEAICPPRLCRALFKIAAQAEPVIPSIRVRMNLGLTRRQQELVPLIRAGAYQQRNCVASEPLRTNYQKPHSPDAAQSRRGRPHRSGGNCRGTRCGRLSAGSLGLGQSGGRGHSGRAGSG